MYWIIIAAIMMGSPPLRATTTQAVTSKPAKKVIGHRTVFRSAQAIIKKVPKKFWPKKHEYWDNLHLANINNQLKKKCADKRVRLTGQFYWADIGPDEVILELVSKSFSYLGKRYQPIIHAKYSTDIKIADKIRRYKPARTRMIRPPRGAELHSSYDKGKRYYYYFRTKRIFIPGPGGGYKTRQDQVRVKYKHTPGTRVTVLGTITKVQIVASVREEYGQTIIQQPSTSEGFWLREFRDQQPPQLQITLKDCKLP